MADIRIQQDVTPINTAKEEFGLIERLAPLKRTMICDDFDKALEILSQYMPLNIVRVPSGTECWTWKIPQKWTAISATVHNKDGELVLDADEHPLALAPYSIPFQGSLSRDELIKHLRWSDKYPDAFVYEFRLGINYAVNDWAFSLPKSRVMALPEGKYDVNIHTQFCDGEMKIGECFLPGQVEETIIFVSHLCHPGQANDGASGVGGLARAWAELSQRKNRRYSYLFLALPETIGSVAWLWARPELASKIVTGINYEMIGVDNKLVLKQSHKPNSIIDRIARKVLECEGDFDIDLRSFRDGYGNDELVFADPDFDIPMIALQHYPFEEYHTSNDDVSTVHEKRLEETHQATMKIVNILEQDFIPRKNYHGPLYLSRYDLYVDPNEDRNLHRQIWNVMQSLGREQSIFEISESLKIPYENLRKYMCKWVEKGLIDPTPSFLLSKDKNF